MLSTDGTYNEHGREIFDEEADPDARDKRQKAGAAGQGGGGGKVARKVARPGNIKAMVMNMAGGAKKKKEVCT